MFFRLQLEGCYVHGCLLTVLTATAPASAATLATEAATAATRTRAEATATAATLATEAAAAATRTRAEAASATTLATTKGATWAIKRAWTAVFFVIWDGLCHADRASTDGLAIELVDGFLHGVFGFYRNEAKTT